LKRRGFSDALSTGNHEPEKPNALALDEARDRANVRSPPRRECVVAPMPGGRAAPDGKMVMYELTDRGQLLLAAVGVQEARS
jgi:hypothetical protein